MLKSQWEALLLGLCLFYSFGIGGIQGTGLFSYIHPVDFKEARRLMLEDMLTVQESGVFNELLWGCDGTAWDTLGCSALRDAIFCLSNYYLIDRLNLGRGFSRANWVDRDGGDKGLLELSSWCNPEVPIWQSQSLARCNEAMSNLSLAFPSAQCRWEGAKKHELRGSGFPQNR